MHSEVLVAEQVRQGGWQISQMPLERKELVKQVRHSVELAALQVLQFDDFLQGLHLLLLLKYDPTLH